MNLSSRSLFIAPAFLIVIGLSSSIQTVTSSPQSATQLGEEESTSLKEGGHFLSSKVDSGSLRGHLMGNQNRARSLSNIYCEAEEDDDDYDDGYETPHCQGDECLIYDIPAQALDFPYFAQLFYTRILGNHAIRYGSCYGSLVTPEFVLSAAHCKFHVILSEYPDVSFDVGKLCCPYGPSSDENCGQDVETLDVDEVFNHPDYSPGRGPRNFDFALVRLKGRSSIPPVSMDTDDITSTYTEGEMLSVPGFGNNEFDGVGQLRHFQVPYVTDSVCADRYTSYYDLGPSIMCAGVLPTDPKPPKSFDIMAGAPLIDPFSRKLVGVASLGDKPETYAKVSDQWESWIKPTICQNHSSPKPDFCAESEPTGLPAAEPSPELTAPTGQPVGQPTQKPTGVPTIFVPPFEP